MPIFISLTWSLTYQKKFYKLKWQILIQCCKIKLTKHHWQAKDAGRQGEKKEYKRQRSNFF
jgi:hypothetical protein